MELGQRTFLSGGIADLTLYPQEGFAPDDAGCWTFRGTCWALRPVPYSGSLRLGEGRTEHGPLTSVSAAATLRLTAAERAALLGRPRRFVLLARTTSGLWLLAGWEAGLELQTDQTWGARPADGEPVAVRIGGEVTDYDLSALRPRVLNLMNEATNDVAGYLNLTVVRGDTLELLLALRDDAGELLDLTGDTYTLTAQDALGRAVGTYTLGDGLRLEGTHELVLALTAAQTALLPLGRFPYTLRRTDADGGRLTWLRGLFTVIG